MAASARSGVLVDIAVGRESHELVFEFGESARAADSEV
jgi:hypothetical protein